MHFDTQTKQLKATAGCCTHRRRPSANKGQFRITCHLYFTFDEKKSQALWGRRRRKTCFLTSRHCHIARLLPSKHPSHFLCQSKCDQRELRADSGRFVRRAAFLPRYRFNASCIKVSHLFDFLKINVGFSLLANIKRQRLSPSLCCSGPHQSRPTPHPPCPPPPLPTPDGGDR